MRIFGAIGAACVAVMLTACTVGEGPPAPSPTEPEEETYAWIEGYDAVAVTIINGAGLDEVLDAFEVDRATEGDETFEQALDRQADASFDYPYILLAATSADPVVIIEPNGFLGADPDRLAALSEAGSAVSVYWNVNALMTFTLAEEGELVRSFDLLIPELPQVGDPLPEETQVPLYEPGREIAAGITLAERVSGVAIDQQWFRTALPSWTSTAEY